MIIRSEDFKSVCNKILGAVDTSDSNLVNETLAINTEGTNIAISVTNREYFAKIGLPLDANEEFHATVNAGLFLKFISQVTSDTIEMKVTEYALEVVANGNYTFPLVFDGDKLLELPEIHIDNIILEQNIPTSVLNDIMVYNGRELSKEGAFQPVQQVYYLDEQGCITFTNGACVNNFTLSTPVKVMLKDKVVKLFKLFSGDTVSFTLGTDVVEGSMMQTKVKFEDENLYITAIVPNDASLFNKFPTQAIRNRANSIYPYSITVDKNQLLQSINRLMIFIEKTRKPVAKFTFNTTSVSICDEHNNNTENIYYNNDATCITSPYVANVNMLDLKLALDACKEQYIQLAFGDGAAFVIRRNNIINIVPEN